MWNISALNTKGFTQLRQACWKTQANAQQHFPYARNMKYCVRPRPSHPSPSYALFHQHDQTIIINFAGQVPILSLKHGIQSRARQRHGSSTTYKFSSLFKVRGVCWLVRRLNITSNCWYYCTRYVKSSPDSLRSWLKRSRNVRHSLIVRDRQWKEQVQFRNNVENRTIRNDNTVRGLQGSIMPPRRLKKLAVQFHKPIFLFH